MLINSALAIAIRNGRQIVEYLFNDTFTTDRAAGAINGTAAEPGPGEREAVDTGNKLTLSGGSAVVATAAPGSGDPGLTSRVQFQRLPGLMVVAQCAPATGVAPGRIGFINITVIPAAFTFNSSNALQTTTQGTNGPTVGAWANGTTYTIIVALRAVGAMFFVKGGTFTNWTLLWLSTAGSTDVKPGLSSVNGGVGFSTPFMRVPAARMLPVPLVSDGFSAWGTSDGFGHAEGLQGGLGAGGNGVAWNGASWGATAGKASNTPTKGSNLLTDGALDAWTSATNLTNWTETVAGTSTVNQETVDVFSGSAARLATDASNSLAKISQVIANSNGDLLLVTFRAKTSVAGRTVAPDENSGATSGQTLVLTTSYVQYPSLIKATKANTDVGIKRVTGTSANIYVDDASVQVVTLSTLRALVTLGKADVYMSAAVTYSAGLVGFMLSVDSAASPANFVLAVISSTTLQLYKMVAGVLSSLSATAITGVATANLVVLKVGTEYRIFYNNAAIVTATIADAGIVSNTIHGPFSTDGNNQIDDLVAYAVGSGGEYSALDSF